MLDREVDSLPDEGMGFTTGLGHGIGIEIGNGSTLRQNGIEPDKKTFGETFGAATGVSEPGYRRYGSETGSSNPIISQKHLRYRDLCGIPSERGDPAYCGAAAGLPPVGLAGGSLAGAGFSIGAG